MRGRRSPRGRRDDHRKLRGGQRTSDPAHPPGEEGVDRRRGAGGVRGGQGPRLDPPGPHVGQELVRDFGQHLFSQAGHAEDVVPPPVDVVPERNELDRGEGREGGGGGGGGEESLIETWKKRDEMKHTLFRLIFGV